MASKKGKQPPTGAPTAEIEPRLFLIRLEGKKPAYVMCERTAIIEEPSEDKDGFAATMFQQIDGLFRERAKIAKSLSAIGIPAEIDPRGGGYMIFGSSMGNGQPD